MANLMRCKACGFVMAESKIGHVCPACGLPKTVFEEYKEKVSAKRIFILGLDLHPIAVHFPQSLSVLIAVFIAGSMIFGSQLAEQLLTASKILVVLLPVSVVGAIVVGFIDAQARFRRINTPMLVKKIVVGMVLLVISVVMCVIVLRSGLTERNAIPILALSIGCIICDILLGRTGGRLMCVRVGG